MKPSPRDNWVTPTHGSLGIESDIDIDFRKFHEENPHVYKRLVQLARRANSNGQKVGMKCLWEVLRWHLMIEVSGYTEFKLNNNFCSRYARMIMEKEPGMDGFFETRTLRS